MTISRRKIIKSSLTFPALYFGLPMGTSYGLMGVNEDCGVASGSPRTDGFFIWTRLPPEGRSSVGDTEVIYEISKSQTFSPIEIVTTGTAITGPTKDFTVNVKIEGLESYTTYFYRFTSKSFQSVVGRAKTAPDVNTNIASLSFGVVSCQKYSDGYYTAFAALNAEKIDFCIHLGDHIYEKETGSVRKDDPLQGNESITLDEYRLKYRHYLGDENYRRARQNFTWIDLLDDHEVFNDYAGQRDRFEHRTRVASAYQAFSEYMPTDGKFSVNSENVPALSVVQSIKFGNLIEFFKMDQRQFRKPNPCSKTFLTKRCDEAELPDHSMLGQAQSAWLKDSIGRSASKWKLLLSEVMFTPLKIKIFDRIGDNRKRIEKLVRHDDFFSRVLDSGGTFMNLDGWDGYPAERERILQFIAAERIPNVVALTGDIHAGANGKLLLDGQSHTARPTAYEIVTTSLTSSSLGDRLGAIFGSLAQSAVNRANPHIEWSNIYEHGYTIVNVSENSLTARHMKMSTITQSRATVSESHSITLANGFNI